MYLGQDEYSEGWYPVGIYPPAEPVADVSWSGYGTPTGEMTVYNVPDQQAQSRSTDSWWSGITGMLVPMSTAAANIIRAFNPAAAPTGYTPTGYTRNAQGQLVPISGTVGFNVQSLLLPAALGVGAYMLLKKQR